MVKDEINCKLVIAGSRDKGKEKDEIDVLIEEKKLHNYVIQIISPPDNVIINLYQHAKLFVFPSFYEGFGYPPLEALVCGCPVITSNIPVLREILGDDIAVFDPYSAKEISLRILKTIKDNTCIEVEKKIGRFLRERKNEEYINVLVNCAGKEASVYP
jgi:glycosyltransferase involved in cell wall biosynthesis